MTRGTSKMTKVVRIGHLGLLPMLPHSRPRNLLKSGLSIEFVGIAETPAK